MDPQPTAPSSPWSEPVAAVADALGVDPQVGLDAADAEARLGRFGPNQLDETPGRPAWKLFLDQFRNLLVVILMFAAALAGLVGEIKDFVVITVVLTINAVLGFVQEHRAAQSLAALRGMLSPTARVRREGELREIDAAGVVPGDVVVLEAGDRVPADARVLKAVSAEVDESALTGESAPVAKRDEVVAGDAGVGDRTGHVHMNSTLTRGRIEAVVTATGMRTEMGRLAELLSGAEAGPTPLQRQLHGLGQRLAAVAGLAVAIFAAVGLLVDGDPLDEVLIDSVAILVAAIPEGLPAVVTLTLAIGVRRMAKRGAIVRRLPSVETLGSTAVICSDKTGTLTRNEMSAERIVAGGHDLRTQEESPDGLTGDAVRPALVAAVLCTDAALGDDGTPVGDPTETALLELARRGGVDLRATRRDSPRVAEVPFDSALKLMATWHDTPDGPLLVAKGAPDVLIDRCATSSLDGEATPIDAAARDRLLAVVHDLADEGGRVLALASARRAAPAEADAPVDQLLAAVTDLELVGFVALVDPPRPQAIDAVARCHQAGIDVKMITGDHAATAAAIARQVGIEGDVVTGADLDHLDDPELDARVEGIGVFARVSPEHKLRIVGALQRRGRITAMTGDGVNDAPALKAADIGVAMGITGTEVTKDAAALVLTDDDFSTIVRAVEGGRAIYANIVKFVRFQVATNIGALSAILGATLLGLPTPFTAIQILWVNLIMDGPPALALGVDPPERGVMDRPPRDPRQGILTGRRIVGLLIVGATMAVGTLVVLDQALGELAEERALTLAFTTFVMFQVFNALNSRAEARSVFDRETFRNWRLWGALGVVVGLQVLITRWGPAQDVFDTVDLGWGDWGLAIAVAASVVVVEELRKLVMGRGGDDTLGSLDDRRNGAEQV
ncbi:MAG TPA: HAD-IC family P-type ATPase [Acidimicrobiales bacterium]|nr:HAD-IC family P-type ATPase [Acidimicrobiales bacterium]